MDTSVERTRIYISWVEQLYQLRVQEAKDQVVNTTYQRGPNHNYGYYLSQLTYLEKNEKLWKQQHYRRYMAAYKIQLLWKKKDRNNLSFR